MKRPDFVTNEQLVRWSDALDKDMKVPPFFKQADLLREIMYAGFWLLESLTELDCDPQIMTQIQFTHGAMSYGNDAWQIADELLLAYKNGELSFIDEKGVEQEINKITKEDVPRDEKTQN